MELPACKRPRTAAPGDDAADQERPAEAMAYWLPAVGDVAEAARQAEGRWPAFCWGREAGRRGWREARGLRARLGRCVLRERVRVIRKRGKLDRCAGRDKIQRKANKDNKTGRRHAHRHRQVKSLEVDLVGRRYVRKDRQVKVMAERR